MRNFRSRRPYYNDDSDYTTNAPSYYDDLARKNKLIKLLAEKIGFYDEELEKRFEEWDKLIEDLPDELKRMLIEWFDDGKLAELLAQLMLEDYATKEWVLNEIDVLLNFIKDEYATKKLLNDYFTTIMSEFERQTNMLKERVSEIEDKINSESVVYTVGSEGDFNTLNSAIEHIENRNFYPKKVEIVLLNDYVMKEQVIIDNKDYGFMEIRSLNTVHCEVNESIKTIPTLTGTLYTPFIYLKNSISPKINVLFKQVTPYNDTLNRISGLVSDNSKIFIEEKKGFNGFSWGGLVLLSQSVGVAIRGNFNGNGNFDEVEPTKENVRTAYKGKGVLVQNSSFIGDYLTANRCGDVGVHVQLASSARFANSEIKYCGHHAIVVSQGSDVTARNGVFTHTQDDNVVCETGGTLDISNSDCSNSYFTNGMVAHRNGTITFLNGKCNNNGGWGIHAVNDGHINAEGAVCKGNGNSGISTGRLGYVYFRYGESSNNKRHGINVANVSQVVAIDCIIDGNTDNGINCSGGEIDISGSKIRNNGNNGVGCYTGGNVKANGSKTIIEFNGQFGMNSEHGNIMIRHIHVHSNEDVDIRVSNSGVIRGNNIKTTNTNKAMYVVSSSGLLHISNSDGYVNMDVNVMQVRGTVISNSLVKEGA